MQASKQATEVISQQQPTPQQTEETISKGIPLKDSAQKGRKSKFAKLGDQNFKTSSLSISELTKSEEKTEEDKISEAYTSDAREPYTQEQFESVWVQFAERIRGEGKEGSSMIYSAMTVRKPALLENFKVELSVDNKSQLEELMDKRTDVHDFLRKRLQNGAIEVQFKVEKDIKQRKAYTDDEKFSKMAEENPDLLLLKKELGLDFV